jgi:L-lactate dehydrogenase complex protein LldE
VKVSLFIPCFIDRIYPHVGVSIVKVLERLGCEVDYPEGQTCCGQPAFNSGCWDEARAVALHALGVFAKSDIIVSASGSCGAMMKVFYPELFHGMERHFDALKLAPKIHEFSDFLVNHLGVRDVGARFDGTVTFHDGCHGLRELGIESQPRELLRHVKGLTLVEMKEAKTCCGFGGAFSVKFPAISTAMGEVKCASALETNAEYIVSNDSSCLMQIEGMLQRQGKPVRCLHLAEVLAQT